MKMLKSAMRRPFEHQLWCEWILAASMIVLTVSSANAQLQIVASADHREYIVREPIIIEVTFANDGHSTMNIPDPSVFDNNMAVLYLEIMGPSGVVEFRRNQYRWEDNIKSPVYAGLPLAPHATMVTDIYPVASFKVDTLSNAVVPGTFGLTFPQLGTYRVKVHYWIDPEHPLLWGAGGASVASNEIEFTIKSGSGSEQEMLNAIWAHGATPLVMGEESAGGGFDEGALRSAIAECPDCRLSPLAKFYLALSLAGIHAYDTAPEAKYREAIAILEDLRQSQPRFRIKETRLALAGAHMQFREFDEALAVIREAIRMSPGLTDNLQVMGMKFAADGNPATSGAGWLKAKMEGTEYEYDHE